MDEVDHGNSAEYRPSSLKVSGGVVGRRVVKDFENILANLQNTYLTSDPMPDEMNLLCVHLLLDES